MADSSSLMEPVMAAISKSNVLISSPGDAYTSDMYASANTGKHKVHLAEKTCYRGKQRVGSNSLSLGSSSNFQISSSALVSEMCLSGSIAMSATTCIPRIGWSLDLIASIEITFASSQMSNVSLNGRLLKEYMLLCCRDADQRSLLLEQCGSPVAGSAVGKFCLPITHIVQGLLGHETMNPIDFGAIGGPFSLQITFFDATKFIEGAGAASIIAFNSLYITMTETVFEDNRFSVAALQARNPRSMYIVPTHNQTNVLETLSGVTLGSERTVTLATLPNGHLMGILLLLEVPAWNTTGVTEDLYPYGLGVSAARLSIDGVDLCRFDSIEEYRHFLFQSMDGDDCQYQVAHGADGGVTSGPTYTALVTRALKRQIVYLPLSYRARETLEKLQENNPNYSNRTLELRFTPQTQASLEEHANATPFRTTASTMTAIGSAINLRIAYLTSANLEIMGGQVALQI